MNRFLLGALVMGAVFVLSSFALTRTATPKTGPAWTVSRYQLDRAFRYSTQLPAGTPLIAQAPPGSGLIITQLKANPASVGVVRVSVNGTPEDFTLILGSPGPLPVYDLNPPIIVRPNDVLSIQYVSGPNNPLDCTIAGYTTLPGET